MSFAFHNDPSAAASLEQQAQSAIAAGKFEEAEGFLRPLLAQGSAPVRIWKLLLHVMRQRNRFAEMEPIQTMLVNAVPGDLAGRFDLGETLLMLGKFDRGWSEYRYRYSLPHTVRIERKVQMPRWDGRRMQGQTLLIHDEQGYGDTFQFLRLLQKAREKSGARIILEIDAATLPFAQRMGGIDMIIPLGTLPPAFDMHCELMSLPMAINLQPEDLPGPMPYLAADAERIERWRPRIDALPGLRVGLVWGGRAQPDPNRSMPLSALAPLAMEGVTFVSLQKGPQAAEAKTPPEGMNFVDLQHEIADFDDTAAIMTHLDLLISIDSSPVHLAGALMRPVWVMLPYLAGWRWYLERADCPWYPSMRLFRQSTQNEWGPVVAQVAAALAEMKNKNARG